MMKLTMDMNSIDLYYTDLFLNDKPMFFVQKFITIVFIIRRGRNKDSRQLSISVTPPAKEVDPKNCLSAAGGDTCLV